MKYRRLFRLPFVGRRRIEREVDEELAFHIEMRMKEYVAAGLDPEEARRKALASFGDLESTRAYLRGESERREKRKRLAIVLEEIVADARGALRRARRSPGFAAVAVLILALGIGANAAGFSVLHAVLLSPLPYPHAERLVRVYDTGPRFDGRHVNVNPMNLLDWREASSSFAALGAYWAPDVGVGGEDGAQLVPAAYATVGFLEALGSTPLLGRTFTAEEYAPGGAALVILSRPFWLSRFAGGREAIGTAIEVEGIPHEVIGVADASARLPGVPEAEQPRLWFPGRIGPHNGRGGHWLRAVGRLAPGVELSRAREEMSAIAGRLEERYPASNRGVQVALEPLRDSVVGDARQILLTLQGAALLILLIACVNVSNLQLARTLGREVEFGVRSALGAGRLRLAQQLVVENLCLAALGGVAGLGLAYGGLAILRRLPGLGIPRLEAVGVDLRVVGFAMLLAFVSGAVIGLVPLIFGLAREPRPSLQQGGRSSTPGRRSQGAAALLAVTQVALAVVLLSGAGLLLRSLMRLTAVDPGFSVEEVVAMRVVLPEARYPGWRERTRFISRLVERTRALPGVEAASAVDSPPFQFEQQSRSSFQPEDRAPPEPDSRPSAFEVYITPGYLTTMGVPLLAGRTITAADDSAAPPVILVNEALADLIWPGENPVGKRMGYNGSREVIGVVGSTRRTDPAVTPEPEMFLPYAQWAYGEAMFIVARTRTTAATLQEFRSLLASLDPNVPLGTATTMEQLASDTLAQPRSQAVLIATFAALAVALALFGIYGMLAYSVSRRTHEFGVRLALGARPNHVLRLVLRRGLAVTGAGILVGILASLWLTRSLEGLLFGVERTDPLTYSVVIALFLAVALLGSYAPARRATQTDAIGALRSE